MTKTRGAPPSLGTCSVVQMRLLVDDIATSVAVGGLAAGVAAAKSEPRQALVVGSIIGLGAAALFWLRRRLVRWSPPNAEEDSIAAAVHEDLVRLERDCPFLSPVAAGLLEAGSLEGAVVAVLADALSSESLPRQTLRRQLLYGAALDASLSVKLREDLSAIADRDPACDSLLEPLLHFKGFKALQTHRIAHALWVHGVASRDRPVALLLQQRTSECFGVDIHPAAQISGGLMIDHATGVVIGSTCHIGPNCSLLHGVTLGASGKDGAGDRHPKLGANVLIGANATVLGNIQLGDGVKIGCNSVLLKPLFAGATAVGIPAKIVGGSKPEPKAEPKPAVASATEAAPVRPPLPPRTASRWTVMKRVLQAVDLSLETPQTSGTSSFHNPWSELEAQGAERLAAGTKGITYLMVLRVLSPLGVGEFDTSSFFHELDNNYDGVLTEEEVRSGWVGAVAGCAPLAALCAAETERTLQKLLSEIK